MVEKDYIMRIIHEMVRAILKLIFHVDEEKQELVFLEGKDQDFYQKLCLMADQGNINGAENMLYEYLESESWTEEEGKPEHLKLSLAFYDYLNEKTSDFLEDHDFSREEVAEGIKSVMKRYGYGGLAETLLENQ
ncbi:DUF6483 family protein [Lachnospiraceae bacterium KK002]